MNLFDKLAVKAEKAGVDKAFAKGLLRCPQCGRKPDRSPENMATLYHCDACGSDALPAEWMPNSGAVPVVDPDDIPAETRITREGLQPGNCIWHIPATGKFGFFLFFGLFWTAITAAVSSAFLFGTPAEGQDVRPWFIYPFFAIFWSVGLGMLYAALRNKYARHRITVTRDLVTLRREMFGRIKEKSLVTTQVESVAQVVFYQQNYQPVYGVEIRGHGGKLRFGTTLTDEEKAWLVADIKRAVFGESSIASSHSPEMISLQRQSSFSFPLPPPFKGLRVMGAIFLLVGVGLIAFIVSRNFDLPKPEREGAGWFVIFDMISSLFDLIPIMMGLFFAGMGGAMLLSSRPGREMRLEADETQVALRTYQAGRVIKEQSFPRGSVTGVRATRMGDANGKPMKRIDLIVDGRATRITRWTDGEVADVWVRDVCLALGK